MSRTLSLKDAQLRTYSSAFQLVSGRYMIFGMMLTEADTDKLLAWLKEERE